MNVVVVISVLLLPAVGYVGAYFWRAAVTTWPRGREIRGYPTEWEAKAFTLLTRIQTSWTGRPVHTVGPSGEVR